MLGLFEKIKNPDLKDKAREDIYMNTFINVLMEIVDIETKEKLNFNVMKALNMTEGMSGLIKEDDRYFMCGVSPSGFPGDNGEPYKVIARYIKDNEVKVKEFTNNKDIVLWYNNNTATPDFNIDRYKHLLSEIDKSIMANLRFSRLSPLLRVKSTTEKVQIEKALKDSENEGKIASFISDNTFEDILENNQDYVINVTDVNNSDKLQYLEHFALGMENRFYSMYGLSFDTTGKMAEQTQKEISGKDALSFVLPVAMLKQAKLFCERANNLFGTDFEAHFGKIHEMKWKEFINDCTKDDTPNGDICEESEPEIDENEGIE